MKRYATLLFMFFACALAFAQNPVKASVKQQPVSGHDDLVDLIFSFAIEPGWHVYGPDNDGGPTPMTFNIETLEGAQLEGALRLSPTPKKVHDNVFECDVTYFETKGTATQRLRLKGGKWKAAGYLEYGTCNDEACMPPTPVEFSFEGEALSSAKDSQTPSSLPLKGENGHLEGGAQGGDAAGNGTGVGTGVEAGTETGAEAGAEAGNEADAQSEVSASSLTEGAEGESSSLWTPVIA